MKYEKARLVRQEIKKTLVSTWGDWVDSLCSDRTLERALEVVTPYKDVFVRACALVCEYGVGSICPWQLPPIAHQYFKRLGLRVAESAIPILYFYWRDDIAKEQDRLYKRGRKTTDYDSFIEREAEKIGLQLSS